MNPEDLLKPRYKVIADYPQPLRDEQSDCYKFIKGDTIIQHDVIMTILGSAVKMYRRTGRCGHMSVGVPMIKHPEKFPAIFRPLSWWEDRSPEDMPGYVKTKNTVRKLVTFLNRGYGIIEGEINTNKQVNLNKYLPATEEEYKAFVNINTPTP